MRKNLVIPLLALLLGIITPSFSFAQDEQEKEKDPPPKEDSINFKGLLIQSSVFLVTQNSVRLLEPKTRNELGGPFMKDWFRSVKSIRGWDDGDTVFTNWVRHPMQGSISAFIFANNDRLSQEAKFGFNKQYLNAKKRQMIFAFIYSETFEFGPISESSIGNLGYRRGKQSYQDHVITPIFGILLSVGEDAVDHYWIQPVYKNHKIIGGIMAFVLNPTHSAANMLAFKPPWYRKN